ncbi:hypothetical protein [Rhodomicrobium lacus]|nr:hypothetical protein [Rhodomicrobium lacus]
MTPPVERDKPDGFSCLRHLLDFDLGGMLVREAIEIALDDGASMWR